MTRGIFGEACLERFKIIPEEPVSRDLYPSMVHEWVWNDSEAWLLLTAQVTLPGFFNIENSTGHGKWLRYLKSYEDVCREAKWLFGAR